MVQSKLIDNLPAHKLAVIEPLSQAAGASILNLSPYSPDFYPIELWWSQLKAFLRDFSPPTSKKVDILLGVGTLIWLILSTLKTGLQGDATVLHKPGSRCIRSRLTKRIAPGTIF
ncbi:transposase [Microcoleus sp. Pol7_A1]|uniref:transposase n=1 Tax=Microcoleus sp. Pol7_A1 TaxID=2818893 RepID=UPI002FD4F3B8